MRLDINRIMRGELAAFLSPGGSPDPRLWQLIRELRPNTHMYDWGYVLQNLLRGSPDGLAYQVGGMYLEFDNSGSPVSPVPSIDRSEGLAYYNDLNDNDSNRDYLRVPLLATKSQNTDNGVYPRDNQAVFTAQSAGVVGVHGLEFSDAASSRIYGGALVVFPQAEDPDSDIVISRAYYPADQQILKPAGAQVVISWPVAFL